MFFSTKNNLLKYDYIPWILFAVVFLMRLSLISKGVYHTDCLGMMTRSLLFLETGKLPYLSGLGFPLTVIIGAMFVGFGKLMNFQTPEFWVNMTGVVFSSLTVVIFYLFIREYFDNRRVALFSAVLLSVSPIFLGLSVYGKSHMPCMYFLMLSLYFLTVYSKKSENRYFILSAVCFGLMGATRIIDFILLIIPLIFLFCSLIINNSKLDRSVFKKAIIFLLIVIFVVAGFYIPLFINEDNRRFFNKLGSDVDIGLMVNFLGILSDRLFMAGRHIIRSLSWVGVFVGGFGCILMFLKDKPKMLFLCLWIAVPLLFYGNLRMTTSSRYFVLILPAIAAFMAYGFNWVYEKSKVARWVVLIFFILLNSYLFLKMYPILKFRNNYATLTEFVKWVEMKTESNAFVVSSDEASFYAQYTNSQLLFRPRHLIKSSEESLNQFKIILDGYLNESIPVYMTGVSLYSYDRDQHFSNFIFENYKVKVMGEHLYESWHTGAMDFNVFPCELFKLESFDKGISDDI